jgi:hypothetical protein
MNLPSPSSTGAVKLLLMCAQRSSSADLLALLGLCIIYRGLLLRLRLLLLLSSASEW